MGIMNLIVIVTIYLFVIGYLGYRGYRGTKTAADYMLAGRQIHPFIMALSYGATFISTSAIVGFGGAASVFGMGLLWLTFLNIFVGIFIAFVFLGGRTRAMGHHLDAHTFPELLGKRFRSKGLQTFAGLVIFLFMPLYTGVVLMGAASFIEVRLEVSYEIALFFFAIIVALYVIMGGLKGVMYTDALQGTIMFIGMAIILFLTYNKLGGIYNAHEALTALADRVPEGMQKGGHQGWTSMPAAFSPLWWTLVSTIILGVGIGVLAQPQLAVRYMTVRSSKELHRAILIGGIFILMMTGTAFVVGSLSNVYFLTQAPQALAEGGGDAAGAVADAAYQGKISVAAAGGVAKVIPTFLASYMPLWLADIFFITLMAAAMSTISSQFHAMGTAAGRDIVETWMVAADPERRERRTIFATRLGVFITFLLSVTLAYVLPQVFEEVGTAIIARGTAIVMGLCAATFLPMYIGALDFRGITKAGAIWGSAAGFLVSAFWLVFVHAKEADALLIARFFLPEGKTSLLQGVTSGPFIWSVVDPLVVALPVTILVTILVSLLTRKFDKAHIDDCFARIHSSSAKAVAARTDGSAS